MSSAKKIFSNLGASFNRLLQGSETENGKEIPCNTKESKSLSYGNQVYKFSENENEQINLPESETNIQTQFVNFENPSTVNTHNRDFSTHLSNEQNTITPSVVRHININEQDRNSRSVIRECITSRDPDMITSNLNKDTFFEQRQQDAVNYDNISTPVSHGIFGSKHNLTFVDSPRDYPLLDQSYITNVEDRNGQNDNTSMHTHQRRDVKWRNVKTTSTGDHMTNVIPQECERVSNWENVLFERVLHDNNQNRDSITQNRNTNIGQQYQTNCFESKTLSREPETLNKFATANPELKRHVQFSHPTTLDRAISLALEFEAFEGSQISPVIKKPQDEDLISPIYTSINGNEKVDQNYSQSSIFTKLVEGMQEVQKSMMESLQGVQKSMETMLQKQNDNVGYRGSRQNKDSTNRRKIQCFYCKEEGHYKRDCPALKNKSYSRSQSQDNGTPSDDLN
ncbi:unnamed protein product [Mytilus coruscus]|uniref:CCHC-type domain-containing protein n=1 Tax=Mytilus coruscus TaxID=42192 RepID=A0A6J8EIJ7_MYTCO|nr:unnamed protein product [Mytilus coruscus]